FAAMTIGGLLTYGYGWRGATIIPLCYSLFCNDSFFTVLCCDHHLMILLAGIGTITSILVPFFKDGNCHARLWFVIAALFHSFGLWISAPSQAIVLIGVFVGFPFVGRKTASAVDSSNWRLFGEISALVSLCIYWFEFRMLLPINVELINPIYSCASLVAGFWLWQMHNFIVSSYKWRFLNSRVLVYSTLLLVVMITPAVIYWQQFYSLADPLHLRWNEKNAELSPVDIISQLTNRSLLLLTVLFVLFSAFFRSRRLVAGKMSLFAILTGCLVVFGWMGSSHLRFLPMFFAGIIIVCGLMFPTFKDRHAFLTMLALMVLIYCQALHVCGIRRWQTNVFGNSSNISTFIAFRAGCERFAKINYSRSLFLSMPDESNPIGYFSDSPAVSIGFWGNPDSLKDACEIFFYYNNSIASSDRWDDVYKIISFRRPKYIIVPLQFRWYRMYTIYGTHQVDAKYTFAWYLLNADSNDLASWLQLKSDDGIFRIFEIHYNNMQSGK
ncbi:MAG TPA: hypothetical protein VLM20_04895, partial [Methylophilaceae bacterium]|nr:hypothetical protein [Methylophilaceae bacterium]